MMTYMMCPFGNLQCGGHAAQSGDAGALESPIGLKICSPLNSEGLKLMIHV